MNPDKVRQESSLKPQYSPPTVELEELELVEDTVLVTVLLEEEEVEEIEVEAVVVVLEELEEDVPLTGSQYGGVGSTQYCSLEQHQTG